MTSLSGAMKTVKWGRRSPQKDRVFNTNKEPISRGIKILIYYNFIQRKLLVSLLIRTNVTDFNILNGFMYVFKL